MPDIEYGVYGSWGDKGEVYAPHRCTHGPVDGCMWCCRKCNHDTHFCPGCGTVTDHWNSACPECQERIYQEDLELVLKRMLDRMTLGEALEIVRHYARTGEVLKSGTPADEHSNRDARPEM